MNLLVNNLFTTGYYLDSLPLIPLDDEKFIALVLSHPNLIMGQNWHENI